jgi:hypothetical protein
VTSQEDTSFPHFFLTIVVVLYYFTTTKKKEGETGHAQNILPDRSSSDHVTNVTSGQKAPLGRILRNFRFSYNHFFYFYIVSIHIGCVVLQVVYHVRTVGVLNNIRVK